MKILEFLAQKKVIVSFAEGRRKLMNGNVKVNDVVANQETEVNENDSVKVGKEEISNGA